MCSYIRITIQKMISVVSLLIFILVMSGGFLLQQAKAAEYTLRFGHWAPPTHSHFHAFERYCKKVEELTNGQVKIEIYGSCSIACEQQGVAAVRAGTLDMSGCSLSNMGQITDAYLPLNIYYTIPSVEALLRLLQNTSFGEEIDTKLQKTRGLKVLLYQPPEGFRVIGNTKREVKLPKDMDGLKLRSTATPIEQSFLKGFGANPIPLPFPEVYSALQQGMLHGVLIDLESMFTNFKEVIKYVTSIYADLSGVQMVAINLKKWNAFPVDIRQAFIQATEKTFNERLMMSSRKREEVINKFESMGIKYYDPTKTELEQWKAKAKSIEKDIFKEGLVTEEAVNRVLEEFAKLRK